MSEQPSKSKEEIRAEQKEMLKAMIQGAKEDPKGAAIFFRDLAKQAAKDAPGKIKAKISARR